MIAEGSSQSANQPVTLTLDLTPQDAQNLVYAQETADLDRPAPTG